MGFIVAAHFQCLRTWGVIHRAFREEIDWVQLRKLLELCGTLWGSKKIYALYNTTNKPGCGLPPHGETYLDRFTFWFQEVWKHEALHQASHLLSSSVATFAAAKELEVALTKL